MKKTKKYQDLLYVLSVFILLAAYGGLFFYCEHESEREQIYLYNEGDPAGTRESIFVTESVSKSWNDEEFHPDAPVGAQYDGILTNGSKYTFRDWKVQLLFSEKLSIDSSWNGSFSTDGYQVLFKAEGDVAHVKAGGQATFGAVLYGEQLASLQGYILSGYRVIHIWDMPVFWLLAVLTVVLVIAWIVRVTVAVRTRKYKKREMLDYEIIKQSMNTFTNFIDAKDTYTKGHSNRVAEYSAEIARMMKFSEDDVKYIYYIALMHDCGKIGIPDAVLKKPCELTGEEYKQIQTHTTIGDGLLKNFTAVAGIRDGAHYHHERYDGKGYPEGLRGEEIPLCARIICVADCYDAMSSDRCYRKAFPEEYVREELISNAGKQFDPEIIPYMLRMMDNGFTRRIQKIYPFS